MATNRFRSRQKTVTNNGKGVTTRGNGLGGRGVGSGTRPPTTTKGTVKGTVTGGTPSGTRRKGASLLGGRVSLFALLFAILAGSFGLFLDGRGGGASPAAVSGSVAGSVGTAVQRLADTLAGSLAGLVGVSPGWSGPPNTGVLNDAVDPAAREKFTALLGEGQDTATVMVYLCGTDLESRNGMATSDLKEMTAADLGENVNVVVYTGGSADWRNQTVSDQVNQVWRVRNHNLENVEPNAGDVAMTDPETLRTFLSYCAANFPATRNILILWDHGGGSLAGYGYDERHASAGALTLADLDTALRGVETKFDFIGFDACLMATAETALTLSRYADYLIASEQTEPGVGWSYTGWLSALGENPSLPTVELGRHIADDFVDACAAECRGQPATLSVVDLAELGETLEGPLNAFSRDTHALIQNSGYRRVSAARSGTREFSSSIDQIDLVHFARNLGTEAGTALADTLLSAVKYNRTGNITNAYGLSIYFPYEASGKVDQAADTYGAIGLDEEYTRCIRAFAALEAGGQAGGTVSPLPALLGEPEDGGAFPDAASLADALEALFAGSGGTEQDPAAMAAYITENRFDPSLLVWRDGKLSLPDEQWARVQGLDLNLFYDNGKGFVDLGLDNVYTFDDAGNLLADFDGTWLSIDGQPVAYYHLATSEDGDAYTISGRVPVRLNGERMDLILLFTDAAPGGYIAGARPVYDSGETETAARGLTPLRVGDTLDFLCDLYAYDGTFQDEYFLGEPLAVTEELVISNTYVGDGAVPSFRFTDLFGRRWWTPPLPLDAGT